VKWTASIGLALVLPVVVEADKWIRRRRSHIPVTVAAATAVSPARAQVPAQRAN
jgi:Ca2+-transporting ATPase